MFCLIINCRLPWSNTFVVITAVTTVKETLLAVVLTMGLVCILFPQDAAAGYAGGSYGGGKFLLFCLFLTCILS